jgi:hypothetical protein
MYRTCRTSLKIPFCLGPSSVQLNFFTVGVVSLSGFFLFLLVSSCLPLQNYPASIPNDNRIGLATRGDIIS